MLGPIDYVVLGFKGNSFDGSILNELSEAVGKKIIRVVDLIFIIKDEKGTVVEGEYEDQSEELKSTFGDMNYENDDALPLLTEKDIATIGEHMESDTAAGVLVIEHLWAKGLKAAISDANGFVIAEGRIHPEAAEAASKELATFNMR
jgi:hypothetical protein